MKIPRIKLDERDLLCVSFIMLSFAWVAQAGISYLFSRSCSTLANGPSATLVQRPDGTAFVAEPKHPDYRDPAVVRNYVENWVTVLFTWTGKLPSAPGKKPILDRGVPLSDGQKVPTNAANAVLALRSSIRENFLKNFITEGWIPEDYFSGEPTTTVLEIEELGQPILVDPQRQIYHVKVVASINYYRNGKPTGKTNYYRREIVVAPIPIPKKPPDEAASIFEQLNYEWRKRGLQIQNANPLLLSSY